jgi:hypothetical protein
MAALGRERLSTLEAMLVLAHAGHWIESIVFGAPVVVLAGALGLDALRNRRRKRREAP